MHSILNSLEQVLLLSDEDPETFVMNSKRTQQLFLNDLLEGRPGLVDAIIQSIEQVTLG